MCGICFIQNVRSSNDNVATNIKFRIFIYMAEFTVSILR